MVEPGTDKIDFTASYYHGGDYKTIDFSDYKDKFVVLFFYPEDFGEAITTQIALMAKRRDISPKNTNCFGISTDSLEAHRFFVEDQLRENIGVDQVMPLICDQTGKISDVFKVFNKDSFTACYSCFVIDDLGTVLACMAGDPKLGLDVEEVGRLVFAVQAAISKDDWHHSMGTPEGWQPGDEFVKIDIVTRVKKLDLNAKEAQDADTAKKAFSSKDGSMGFRFWAKLICNFLIPIK
jgi:peroxiredoxin (alkyl hydroperoxide reductase subunit C)